MKANIEEIKWSVIDHDVKFTSSYIPILDMYQVRKDHKKHTEMIWITKKPIIDKYNNLFNPRAVIMLFLN